jgi:hypothetical protein
MFIEVSLLRLYSGFRSEVPFGKFSVKITLRLPPIRRSKTKS